jgi:hypothetical protein
LSAGNGWSDQGAAEIARRIRLGSSRRDGKAKHSAHGAAQAGRSLMLPALLDLSQRVKDFRGFELSNRPLAQLLVGKIQQPLLLLQRGRCVASASNLSMSSLATAQMYCFAQFALVGVPPYARRRDQCRQPAVSWHGCAWCGHRRARRRDTGQSRAASAWRQSYKRSARALIRFW